MGINSKIQGTGTATLKIFIRSVLIAAFFYVFSISNRDPLSNMLHFGTSLAGLIICAEAFVYLAAKLARQAGISEMVVGLTIVAVGTSMPEVFSAMAAGFQQTTEFYGSIVAMGDFYGSLLVNMTLVLGITAVARSVLTDRKQVVRDGAIMLVLIIIVMIYTYLTGRLDTVFSLALIVGFMLYTALLIKHQKAGITRHIGISAETAHSREKRVPGGILVIGSIVAVAGLVFTSWDLIAAIKLWPVEEHVSGLVIGVGTSLPELVVVILAIKAPRADMAIGCLLGSNIADISIVAGMSSIAQINTLGFDFNLGLASSDAAYGVLYTRSLLVMPTLTIIVLVVSVAFLYTRQNKGEKCGALERSEGGILVALYAASTLLLMGGLDNGTLAVWGAIMITTIVAIFYGKRVFHKHLVVFDNEIIIHDA